MRIWVFNHYADPPDGLSTRSFDLARRMVERGHQVAIFSSAFSHYSFTNQRQIKWPFLWTEEWIQGVRFVWIRTVPYQRNDFRRVLNMISFGLAAWVAGVASGPRPDIVSGVTVHPLAALAGWGVARWHRSRYFIEVTDLWPQSLIDLGAFSQRSLPARLLRALERFLYQRAERIVMLWRHTDDYVRSLGIPTAKILWLTHGVEVARYADLRRYEGAPDAPFRIMYLGAFVASMAIDVILDAAEILLRRGRSDIEFRLIGAGTYRADIIAQADRMHLTNVVFPGAVQKPEIGRVMNDADAFIFGVRDAPLYRYGMSLNKLTDYLVGGRPIIYYGRSTYNPVEEAAAGFSVPPDDPVAVAAAIEQLVALPPEKRMILGENGRSWALQYHNIPALADRLLEAFRGGS